MMNRRTFLKGTTGLVGASALGDMDLSALAKVAPSDIELVMKERCEKSLHTFIRHFWREMDPSTYVDGWHIELICEHLEAVSRGEIRRLVINIPPRHMKSLATAVAWPAWTWAQDVSAGDRDMTPLRGPQVRFLSASYAHTLATRDSRKSRLLVQSPRYQRYWGERFALMGDQNAKYRFENTMGGYRLATSVDGTATGEGGDIGLIDDPLNAREKEQELARLTCLEWWREVMSTRLNDQVWGAFVVIMQRLHQQDLTGYVIEHEDDWVHLCLPARYEPEHPHVYDNDPRTKLGELLWPDKVPEHALQRLENTLGSYGAAGQLQQRPAPREGGMFQRNWYDIVDAAPAHGQVVRGWDLAGSTGVGVPYTAGVKIKKVGGIYYVEDVIRERGTPLDVEKCMVNTAKQDGPAVIVDFPQDPGQAGKHQARYLVGQLAGFNARFSVETGAKETRADPYSAQSEAGNVKLVRGPWNERYLQELELFPNGEYSDQVDASSRAFARLSREHIYTGAGAIVIE